jgi:hypothetical protein
MSADDDIVQSLLGVVDTMLGVRDDIGAKIHDVFILTRTWTGERPGDGTDSEERVQILPSPQIVDYSQNLRITEGGAIKSGDIILKNLSRNTYPDESFLDCSTDARNIERYYFINDRQYTVIQVKESYLTWDIHLRKRSDETRKGD